MRARRALVLAITAMAMLAGCGDPLHDAAVDALGPETPGIPHGPLHRAGQPCLVCHGGMGPGGQTFSMAGTVYQYPDQTGAVESAAVALVDAANSDQTLETNAVGNFYIQDSDWSPTYPVHVTGISCGSTNSLPMNTHIGRDGSCASCHTGVNSLSTVVHVYVAADDSVPVGNGGKCP